MPATSSIALWSRPWFTPFLWTAATLMLAATTAGVFLNALGGVPDQTDFTQFHSAIVSYRQGHSLYQAFVYILQLQQVVFIGSVASDKVSANLNPPVVSFLFYPLGWLGLRDAYYVFCYSQLALALIALRSLLRHYAPVHPALLPAGIILLLAYFPTFSNLLIGQLGLFLFALLVMAVIAIDKKCWRTAGIWLGLALLLKLFVGLVFVWLALTRRWLCLFWGALVYALGMMAALLVFGVQNHLDWLKAIARYDAGALSWNAALQGVFERYLGASTSVYSLFHLPWLCFALRSLAIVLAALALIWLARQRHGFTPGLCCSLPLMLLLAPLGWIYYFPVLLICALLLWRESAALANPSPLRWGIAGAVLLTGNPQLLSAGDFYTPSLWKSYDKGGYSVMVDGVQQTIRYGVYKWYEIPELYTLGLLVFAILPVWLAYKLRDKSAQTGA